jgi:hypothetical protein
MASSWSAAAAMMRAASAASGFARKSSDGGAKAVWRSGIVVPEDWQAASRVSTDWVMRARSCRTGDTMEI